jgi:long-chain acyl-CoA synthetase
MFIDRAAAMPNHEAFRFPVLGGWESLTWGQTQERVFDLAAGLLTLGIEPEDRVAIIASTRVEWILADLAILCAGAATTTVYPTTEPEDVAYIVSNSGSKVVFAEDATQVAKLREHRADMPRVVHAVLVDGKPDPADGDWVLAWDDVVDRGRKHRNGSADHRGDPA